MDIIYFGALTFHVYWWCGLSGRKWPTGDYAIYGKPFVFSLKCHDEYSCNKSCLIVNNPVQYDLWK